MKPDVVALASNRSDQEAEAEGLTVRDQPGVQISQRLKQPLFVIYTTCLPPRPAGMALRQQRPSRKGWVE